MPVTTRRLYAVAIQECAVRLAGGEDISDDYLVELAIEGLKVGSVDEPTTRLACLHGDGKDHARSLFWDVVAAVAPDHLDELLLAEENVRRTLVDILSGFTPPLCGACDLFYGRLEASVEKSGVDLSGLRAEYLMIEDEHDLKPSFLRTARENDIQEIQEAALLRKEVRAILVSHWKGYGPIETTVGPDDV